MNSTILQIPIKKQVRDQAASVAERMGFSSIQEVVRLFLNKMAAEEIDVRFEETIRLSLEAKNRYNQMIDEMQSGKAKIKSFTNINSLMKHLNED